MKREHIELNALLNWGQSLPNHFNHCRQTRVSSFCTLDLHHITESTASRPLLLNWSQKADTGSPRKQSLQLVHGFLTSCAISYLLSFYLCSTPLPYWKKKLGNQHPPPASATPSTTRLPHQAQANCKYFIIFFREAIVCNISNRLPLVPLETLDGTQPLGCAVHTPWYGMAAQCHTQTFWRCTQSHYWCHWWRH